jgi:hypothetical protein
MACCEDLGAEMEKILDAHSKLMNSLAPKPATAKK